MAGVIHGSMGMAWAVASVSTSSLGTPSKCIMLPLNQQFIFFNIITDISHHYSNFILIYEHPDKQSLNKDACNTLLLLKVNGKKVIHCKKILKTVIDKYKSSYFYKQFENSVILSCIALVTTQKNFVYGTRSGVIAIMGIISVYRPTIATGKLTVYDLRPHRIRAVRLYVWILPGTRERRVQQQTIRH